MVLKTMLFVFVSASLRTLFSIAIKLLVLKLMLVRRVLKVKLDYCTHSIPVYPLSLNWNRLIYTEPYYVTISYTPQISCRSISLNKYIVIHNKLLQIWPLFLRKFIEPMSHCIRCINWVRHSFNGFNFIRVWLEPVFGHYMAQIFHF